MNRKSLIIFSSAVTLEVRNMRRKLISLILVVLVVPLLLPSITATSTVETKKEIFTSCYLEASGAIDFTYQLNDILVGLRYRLISFWPIVFNEPTVDVTIYSKKNGNILWEDNFDSGQWVLYLVGFIGKYNNDGSTADTLIANLDGRACFIMISPAKEKTDSATPQSSESVTPSVSMTDIKPVITQGRYQDCYLEISGYMHNDWPAIVKFPNMIQVLWKYEPDTTHILYGLYSYILFEKDANIKVYDEKGGDLLWQHDGNVNPLITLIGFSGDSVIDDPPGTLPYITINGDARFLGIKLRIYP
jgi:hypothetical protein